VGGWKVIKSRRSKARNVVATVSSIVVDDDDDPVTSDNSRCKNCVTSPRQCLRTHPAAMVQHSFTTASERSIIPNHVMTNNVNNKQAHHHAHVLAYLR
jgi:hypothetical protein